MTRLFVSILCEKCGKAHGVTNERSYLGAKPITEGICIECLFNEHEESKLKNTAD